MTKKTKQREIFEKAVEDFWHDFDKDGHFSFYQLASKIELFIEQNPHKVPMTGHHAALSGLMAARYQDNGVDWHELNGHGLLLLTVWLAGWRMARKEFELDLANAEVI